MFAELQKPEAPKAEGSINEFGIWYLQNLASTNIWDINYRKVVNSSLSWLVARFSDFQKAYGGEIWCLCTVTLWPKEFKIE